MFSADNVGANVCSQKEFGIGTQGRKSISREKCFQRTKREDEAEKEKKGQSPSAT